MGTLGREYPPGSRVVKDTAAPSLASWVDWVAFDGADITKVPDPGYILGSDRRALTGTSADLLANGPLERVYMGLERRHRDRRRRGRRP